MKIVNVQPLALPDVKVIRFARFRDGRGYFTELFRKSDLSAADVGSLRNLEIFQINESVSEAGVCRGLHFQWNPFMGKLLRTLSGRMVDMIMDIRKGSPDYGKIIQYDMPANPDAEEDEWIWVPPGFAHGNWFTEPTRIQYLCTGEWSPKCEAGINPLAKDLDWSLCDPALAAEFRALSPKLSEKDLAAPDLAGWTRDDRSENFVHGKC